MSRFSPSLISDLLLTNSLEICNKNNMAGARRIEYEGALYHVLSRGNERQNIVTNDDDRKLF
jgi:hypothetical protein